MDMWHTEVWSRAMNAFHRSARFGSIVKERASLILKSAPVQCGQWLIRRGPLLALVTVGCVLLALIPCFWKVYKSDPDIFTPFFTPIAALLVGVAAFGQWRTARLRHEEQTNADRQRRLTESFSKAIEQLGSDKLEVRLGGVYALERISKESPDDYWTVMENLSAFVRERSRRPEIGRMSASFEQRRTRLRAHLLWTAAGAPYSFEQRVKRRAYFLWEEAGGPDGQAEDFWAQALE
jgi:hypothetical protein